MKVKCIVLRVSIIIWIFSLIGMITTNIIAIVCETSWIKMIYDIFLGLFGSSFVVFLIAIVEYNDAKRKVLEEIYREFTDFIQKISEIEPLVFGYENDLIIKCIFEWEKNGKKYIEINHRNNKNLQKLKNIIEKDLKEYSIKDEKILVNELEREMKKIDNEITRVIKEYERMKDYSFSKLNVLYGDVEFFLGNNNKKNIYNKLYEPSYKIIDFIKNDLCYHISINKIDEEFCNKYVLVEKILNNQDKLYEKRIVKNNGRKCICIYQKYIDDMIKNLEYLRAKIIYNVKEEVYELGPYSIISNLRKE